MSFKQAVTLSLFFLALVSLLCATRISRAQAPTIISGKFYKFDVIAASNEAPLTNLLAAPSINDNGVVSFIGNAGGNNVFISKSIEF